MIFFQFFSYVILACQCVWSREEADQGPVSVIGIPVFLQWLILVVVFNVYEELIAYCYLYRLTQKGEFLWLCWDYSTDSCNFCLHSWRLEMPIRHENSEGNFYVLWKYSANKFTWSMSCFCFPFSFSLLSAWFWWDMVLMLIYHRTVECF